MPVLRESSPESEVVLKDFGSALTFKLADPHGMTLAQLSEKIID
jgi:hypothetical protein